MTKALVIEANGQIRYETVGDLESLQRLVGGYIEGLLLGDTDQFVYVNEDGIERCLPRNDVATRLCFRHNTGLHPDDYIKGPMIVVGAPDDDGKNTDVSPVIVADLVAHGSNSP